MRAPGCRSVVEEIRKTDPLLRDPERQRSRQTNKVGRNDPFEILDDRTARRATIITSQLPAKAWHHHLGDPVADAIMDRLVHGSHQIVLRGESMRKRAQAIHPSKVDRSTGGDNKSE